MSLITGGATIAVIDTRHGSMECRMFPTRLAAVLALIDDGGIGGGGFFGDTKHKDALAQIEQQIAVTRATIQKNEQREIAIAAEPKVPPCQRCGAKSLQEAEMRCKPDGDDCHGSRLWPEY